MLSFKVGVAGFEPATSASQTRRDNRATLHPENWLSFKDCKYIVFLQNKNKIPIKLKALYQSLSFIG